MIALESVEAFCLSAAATARLLCDFVDFDSQEIRVCLYIDC
jgi:hypothetical protein